jgi:hypothetical protein
MTNGEKRRTIRMDDPTWDALARAAAAEGRTSSEVIRRLVRDHVDAPRPEGKEVGVAQLALTAVALALGAPPDRLDDVWVLVRRNRIARSSNEVAATVQAAIDALN